MPRHLKSRDVEPGCSSTWAGDETGLLHLLLDLPPQFVSTELLVHGLRRRLGPVAPVDDTRQVPSPKPLTTLCTLHRQTHKYDLCEIDKKHLFD